ncbi:hypothetical protein C7Y71_005505 [Pseudoprevotella muciniphila]|uniref:Uncharacterized protein n=2 Tax=Pseudoprevotella muciniphila TaxID=2133944 RepID=A0A5P8E6E6_9BACT|nr:hypothetical protein C7Y71_005505 [Pseudoprevotella muciniphila]
MWGQTGPNGSTQVSSAEITTGYYYLYNNGAAKFLSGSTGAYQWVDETSLTGDAGLWYIQNEGAGSDGNIRYYVQVKGSNNYFGGVGPECPLNSSGVYQRISVRESGAYYTLSGHQVVSQIGNKTAIKYNGTSGNLIYRNGGDINSSSFPTESQWVIYKAAVSITYTIAVTGTNDANAGVQYQGTNYTNGSTFSTSDDISASDFTANEVTGYKATVTVNGTTIKVNYVEAKYAVDFTDLYVTNTSVATTTDPIVEGQWYVLTQIRNGESPAYDNGTGNNIKRAQTSVTANTLLVTNTPANDIKKYLIRFFSTGEGNGYKIQFGTGNFWYGTGSGNGAHLYANATNSTAFLVYNATQTSGNSTGWAINETTNGTTYGRKVDNNGAGETVAFWDNGQTSSGGNNVWKLYPVELGALVRDINFNLEITDGTVTKTFSSVTKPEGTTISAMDFLGISTQYATSTSHTLTTADDGQTVTLTVTPTAALPVANGAYYAWQTAVGNNPSYIHVDENGAAVNPNGYSINLTKPVTVDHVWQIEGNIINGFSLKNDKTSQYLGGRTAAAGYMAMEATPSLFAPVYNNATTFKWKNVDYGYWIDRASAKPYAHTSGNNNSLTQLYPVTFALSDATAGNIIVGGDTISDFTQTYYISSDATIALVAQDFSILDYNGSATVAEALAALGAAGGTLTINVTQEMSNVTINVVKDGQTVKTVTVENVAAGRAVDVAEAIGDVPYVTGYDPATITATADDQTVNVTYTSSLPFTLAADPTSSEAPTYAMTLREKYAHGNIALSTSQYDITDEYLWTFGGDEFNGVTVYNKDFGYMNVGSESDNSVATFSSTPTLFTIKPNSNQANGFNLNIPNTNAYINLRGDYVSTWLSDYADGEVGSCLVAIPEATHLANLINKLEDYFHTTDFVGALASADTAALRVDYEALKANPTKANYQTFKAELEANFIDITPGAYYIVRSAFSGFYTNQGEYKAWYYSASTGSVKWKNMDASPEYQVFQVVANDNGDNVFYNPMAGVYLTAADGSVSSDINAAKAFTLTALGGGQQNILLDGITTPIHAAGHNNGQGINGNLTNWSGSANSASSWYIIPQNIEEITLIAPTGVAEGEEVIQGFANATDAQLPTSIGVFTITEDLAAGAHLDTIASGKIAAGQGYLISGVKGAKVPLLPVASAVEAPVGNLLVAGQGTIVNGGYILAYKKGDTEAKFYQINGLTVPENRSYLPEGTPTRGLEFLFGGLGDDVTGINGITTGAENGAIYDLQGRRVNNAQKGVYIINGKKVIK